MHDEHRDSPSLAFALARLASAPTMPTPIGVFRDVERPSYEVEVQRQLVGGGRSVRVPATSPRCISSGATWEVT